MCAQLRENSAQKSVVPIPNSSGINQEHTAVKHTWFRYWLLTWLKGPLPKQLISLYILQLLSHPEPTSSCVSQYFSRFLLTSLFFPTVASSPETTWYYQPSSKSSLSQTTNCKTDNKELSQYWESHQPCGSFVEHTITLPKT